ncbi:hypothetical protein KDA14_06240, partial [Candidatus Saccharibacteria bacterium]|nr:hypothetical protein [Candidatus Saccharibacteria bacterium]
AKHLFYVNKPEIIGGEAFTADCPTGGEKTIVLGCYQSKDRGIFLYKVEDQRLDGVVQVTAAHEMLHAAYDRLSDEERSRVDSMLESFYKTGLSDQRVKDTIAAYKDSEPSEIDNEMHSIFGTEVANLPKELETYYTQYFKNRQAVVQFATDYQAEFTSRQNQVETYDAQLKALKQTIDANEKTLATMRASINALRDELDSLKAAQNYEAYNAKVSSYNQSVRAYNVLLAQTRTAIQQYNDIVDARNAIALEEEQLVQAISAQSLPSAQ